MTVRLEGETIVVTADRGVGALHVANTITFSVPPTCALDKFEKDEAGRLVLTFTPRRAPYLVGPLGRCTVPAAPSTRRPAR